MRIAYIARHNSGGGDDEGAIAYAIQQLGHEVIKVPESRNTPRYQRVDLTLFHKWEPNRTFTSPSVFWYFDLVDYSDPGISKRCALRKRWMSRVLPMVDLGFCTDGDWVANNTTGKLVWLPQGADERVVGCNPSYKTIPLLFTGIADGGGAGREQWVEWCREMYGNRFTQVSSGVYREELRNLVGHSQVVLCPDSPVTHNYWSNRVYNLAGFGGTIVHPYCRKLEEHFKEGSEILFYTPGDRESLRTAISLILHPDSKEYCDELGTNALARVRKEHLYRHRCETLIATVKERLKI